MSAKGKRPSSPWQVRTGKQILKQVEDSVFLHYIEFRRASAILNSAQYLSDAQKQRALFVRYCCRSPRGERGLKFRISKVNKTDSRAVAPLAGSVD